MTPLLSPLYNCTDLRSPLCIPLYYYYYYYYYYKGTLKRGKETENKETEGLTLTHIHPSLFESLVERPIVGVRSEIPIPAITENSTNSELSRSVKAGIAFLCISAII